MAFENKEVLRAVLEVCEPDSSIRKTCMGLSGLPFDYILKANDNLDYMERFYARLTDCHVGLHQEYIQKSIPIRLKPDLNFVMSDALEWFISFNSNMASLVNQHTHIKNIILLLTPTEYMESRFLKLHEYWYKRSMKAAIGLSSKSEYKAPWYSDVEEASSYYNELLLPVLNFLSSGIGMDENTPSELLDTWLSLFDLFGNINSDSWKSPEYEEVDNGI